LGIVLYALLSGRLPFEVEGENNVRELMKVINTGLTEKNMSNLGHVSMKSKLLISQLLQVDQEERIKLPEVSNHIWLSKLNDYGEIGISSYTMPLSMQMEVAKLVQVKLKLNHLTLNQILAYVMSAKGMYGKTAGCFNILARELVTSTTSKKDYTGAKHVRNPDPVKRTTEISTTISSKLKESQSHEISKPIIIQQEKSSQNQNGPPSPALRNLDRLLQRKQDPGYLQSQSQQTSFWSSTFKVNPITKSTIEEEKENATGRQVGGKKARREIVESSENTRKRNLVLTGQGRVKRVEFDVDKVQTCKEEVIRTPLASKQDNNNQ